MSSLWESSFADDESLYALASSVSRELRVAEEASRALEAEKEKTRKAMQECLAWRRKFEHCSKRLRRVRTQRDLERARFLTALTAAKSERAGRRSDLRSTVEFGSRCAENALMFEDIRDVIMSQQDVPLSRGNIVEVPRPPLILTPVLPPPLPFLGGLLESRDAAVVRQTRRQLEARDSAAVKEMRKMLNRCCNRASKATDATLSSLERVVSLLERARNDEHRQRRRADDLANDLRLARAEVDRAKDIALADLQPQIEDQLRAALAASDAARDDGSGSSSEKKNAGLVKALQAELAQTKLFCEVLQQQQQQQERMV